MTKETKIGLLVGCFVIILIGILISDHLAKVQDQQPAQIAEAMLSDDVNHPRSILPETGVEAPYPATARREPLPLPQEIVEPEPEPAASGVTPYILHQDLPMHALIDDAATPGNGSSASSFQGSSSASAMTPDQAMPESFVAVNGVGDQSREYALNPQATDGRTGFGFGTNAPRDDAGGTGARGQGEHGVRYSNRGPVARDGLERGVQLSQGQQRGVYGQGQTSSPPVPQNAGAPQAGSRFASQGDNRLNPQGVNPNSVRGSGLRPQSPAPKVVYHTVKEGETLSEISREYYGTTKHYQKIYEANRKQIPSVDYVRHGVLIVIPQLADPRGGGANPAVSSIQRPVQQPNPVRESPANRPMSVRSYTIRENDTLSSIAEKYYGTSKAWHKLYTLNKDRISDPDRVKPGLVINVPSR